MSVALGTRSRHLLLLLGRFCDGRWGWSGWWRIGGDMVKSTGRRGGLQSRWARGGGVLFLAGTLGWILFSAGQVIFLRIFSLFNVLTISKIRLLIVPHVWVNGCGWSQFLMQSLVWQP